MDKIDSFTHQMWIKPPLSTYLSTSFPQEKALISRKKIEFSTETVDRVKQKHNFVEKCLNMLVNVETVEKCKKSL